MKKLSLGFACLVSAPHFGRLEDRALDLEGIAVRNMSGRLTHLAVRVIDRAAKWVLRPPSGPSHLLTGQQGEEDAYFYLRRQGYVMVARNYRSPHFHGEIDLIGWEGDVLCFVEVKTRTTHDVKPAEAAVDENKKRDISNVAQDYLRHISGTPALRFDVVSVYYDAAERSPQITLFKNAFSVA